MGNSRKPGSLSSVPRHVRGELAFPSRTPGPLGWNDAGDPTRLALLGDTPGPLGSNDHGSAGRLTLPGLRTLHDWFDESDVHIAPRMQIGHYLPAGEQQDVLARAAAFIMKWESVEEFPYVPGAGSGITIGVGYDIGQTSEQDFRKDWAEIGSLTSVGAASSGSATTLLRTGAPTSSAMLGISADFGPGPPKPAPLFPFKSPLFSLLDRLAFAANGKLSHAQALQYVSEISDIAIPKGLSVKVFQTCSLPKWYRRTVAALTGFKDLPAGFQVAILSLVYNRGEPGSGKSKSHTKAAGPDEDIFDARWEMGELRSAVLTRDLVWIYWYFESMRRVWLASADKSVAGIVKRRDAELALMFPSVASDLQHEAFLQRNPRWR
jgi:hypothetical protein